MKKPKLTLVTLEYPPQRGGIASYLWNLVKASGDEIRVISRPGNSRWWSLVFACWRSRSVVLVSHVFPAGTAAWVARLLGGPSYMVLFHGLDLRRIPPNKIWLLKRICASAKALLVNSASTGTDLKRLLPDVTYTILTPGVEMHNVLSREEARQKLGIPANQKVVLSIARLIPRKGIDVAIRAVAKIQAHCGVCEGKCGMRYAVVGDGPERARLEELAETTGACVTWLHDADNETKWMWLAASDVFLMPVRDDGDDVEGFGIVYLEAALAGVPSIAGRSGGAIEAIVNGKTGILVDPNAEDEVRMAILAMASGGGEVKQRFGAAAKERVLREFRWEDRWATLKQLLES